MFVMGNPPYLGSSMQDKEQKKDLELVCGHFTNYKNLDYIASWFYLGAKYIKDSQSRNAFVSTNSITQGEQVALLWPNILDLGLEINFAHTSFKWDNNAKHNAGVICVVIGVGCNKNENKIIYSGNKAYKVNVINAYLLPMTNIFIRSLSLPISELPIMDYGNKPVDGTHLRLTREEMNELLSENAEAKKFVRKFTGSEESIKGLERYCLWIYDIDLTEALQYPFIKNKVELCREMRLGSKDIGANKLAERSHQF